MCSSLFPVEQVDPTTCLSGTLGKMFTFLNFDFKRISTVLPREIFSAEKSKSPIVNNKGKKL